MFFGQATISCFSKNNTKIVEIFNYLKIQIFKLMVTVLIPGDRVFDLRV
jgi:hypothetical protein